MYWEKIILGGGITIPCRPLKPAKMQRDQTAVLNEQES